MASSKVCSGAARRAPFIVDPAGKRERERVKVAFPVFRRQGDERRGVNTAAEKHSHWSIADEVMLDRIEQGRSGARNRIIAIGRGVERQLPVPMRCQRAVLPDRVASGLETFTVAEERAR